MEPKKVFWKASWKIPGTTWTMCGYSRAGYRSGFYIKALNCMLDAGPQLFKKPDHIFITHTHADHIANLPFTLISDEDCQHKPDIYAPIESGKYLANFINSMFEVNCLLPVDSSKWYRFHGYSGVNTFRTDINGTPMEITTFNCCHRIPTISYGFSMIKKKLLPQYHGLSGPEIVALKKAGIEITWESIIPKFAYICDTTTAVFETNDFLFKYPVIIIECTFLEVNELASAAKTRHVHWQLLKPYVLANPEVTFMLIHFSFRYSDADIKKFFQKECAAAGIKNVNLWLSDGSAGPVKIKPLDVLTKLEDDVAELDMVTLKSLIDCEWQNNFIDYWQTWDKAADYSAKWGAVGAPTASTSDSRPTDWAVTVDGAPMESN